MTVTQLASCEACQHWQSDNSLTASRSLNPKRVTEGHHRTKKAGWCTLGSAGILTMATDRCLAFERKGFDDAKEG